MRDNYLLPLSPISHNLPHPYLSSLSPSDFNSVSPFLQLRGQSVEDVGQAFFGAPGVFRQLRGHFVSQGELAAGLRGSFELGRGEGVWEYGSVRVWENQSFTLPPTPHSGQKPLKNRFFRFRKAQIWV
jgi:hypothetical protein